MEALAVKYRPKEFSDVSSQKINIRILEKMLETNQISNCILFSGPSGCGKTTLAKIFADKINKGQGNPIEIDGASNNGVDNVRNIIENSKERSIDGTYKVYIIDECHQITTAGWNAFLKCIEEPPMFTIFIFCTTDPQKIPPTILNRLMKFQLTKISSEEIEQRLLYICQQENFVNYQECCNYISKNSNGGMRDAIANLEKCASYSNDLNINNVLEVLGNCDYNMMFDIVNAIIDNNRQYILDILSYIRNSGKDLRNFVNQFLDFILNISKYCLYQKNINVTVFPSTVEEKLKYTTAIDNAADYFIWLLNKIYNIKATIKYETNLFNTLQILFLGLYGA